MMNGISELWLVFSFALRVDAQAAAAERGAWFCFHKLPGKVHWRLDINIQAASVIKTTITIYEKACFYHSEHIQEQTRIIVVGVFYPY